MCQQYFDSKNLFVYNRHLVLTKLKIRDENEFINLFFNENKFSIKKFFNFMTMELHVLNFHKEH